MIDPITLLRAAEAGLPAGETHPDPPLVCFPLRSDWERARGDEIEREPYPAPAVSSRDGVEPTLWPSALLRMQSYALERGWKVARQYSQGCMPHGATGRPGPIKGWYGLRLAGDGRAAWMVHDGTKWSSACIWGEDVSPIAGDIAVTVIKAWIDGVGDPRRFAMDLAVSLDVAARRRTVQARESAARRGSKGSGEGL